MAEVLSVVASGIAVTQAAQTVGQAIFSVQLWREVKDAPETIQNMLDDLEVTGELVAAIEAELESSALSTGPDGNSCLTPLQDLTIRRCRQIQKKLGDFVGDLAADIASSRKRKRLLAKAQVVLKKETLASYERRLEKALASLNSTLQLNLMTSIKQQPKLILAEITNVMIASSDPPQTAQDGPHISTEVSRIEDENLEERQAIRRPIGNPPKKIVYQRKGHLRALLAQLGFVVTKTEEESDGLWAATSYRVAVSPPRWLLSKAWDFQVSLACSGWTTHLRQYAVLPDDSPLFRVIEKGTIEDLQDLISTGRASPFSVDSGGWTLLHHAAFHRWSFIEPLVQMGLDLSAGSVGSRYVVKPTDLFEPNWPRDADGFKDAKVTKFHRFLLAKGVYDEAWEESAGLRFEFIASGLQNMIITEMTRSVELFEFFRANLFPDFYQWPIELRFYLLDLEVFYDHIDSKVIGRFCDPDGRFCPEHLRHWSSFLGKTILQEFARLYFKQCLRYCGTQQPTRETGLRHGQFQDLDLTQGWNQMRSTMRDMASVVDIGDLSAPDRIKSGTALVWAIMHWRHMGHWMWIDDSETQKPRWCWKRLLREYVKFWLEDLLEAGHDLEAYGKAEMAVFHLQDQSSPRTTPEILLMCWPPKCFTGIGSSEGPHRWQGFKYGPRPEDWDLIWELNPAAEGFVRDFWDWVENPPLVVPGAWVDDD